MQTFTIHYTIRFVAGTLEGLTAKCTITYPESDRDLVIAEYDRDVMTGRVMKGTTSSDYVIEQYWEEVYLPEKGR